MDLIPMLCGGSPQLRFTDTSCCLVWRRPVGGRQAGRVVHTENPPVSPPVFVSKNSPPHFFYQKTPQSVPFLTQRPLPHFCHQKPPIYTILYQKKNTRTIFFLPKHPPIGTNSYQPPPPPNLYQFLPKKPLICTSFFDQKTRCKVFGGAW